MVTVTRLKLAILRSGMTATFVAKKAGLSRPMVSQFCSGAMVPNAKQAEKLALALGIAARKLFTKIRP